MSVETENQDINVELEELKAEAKSLGIKYHPNTGVEKLSKKIEELKEKQDGLQVKETKKEVKKPEKIRIIVESRDGDSTTDQFFGLSSMATGKRESILVQFGEEIEVSPEMYEHIRSKGGHVKKFKMVTDPDTGGQKKEWYDKWQSRFIVSKV